MSNCVYGKAAGQATRGVRFLRLWVRCEAATEDACAKLSSTCAWPTGHSRRSRPWSTANRMKQTRDAKEITNMHLLVKPVDGVRVGAAEVGGY